MAQQPRRGFTLVETLIAVAIIGLVVAIAAPMWLNSINRAKQARTMANMRQIGSAWESRAAEYKAYTAAGVKWTLPPTVLPKTSLENLLAPTYIKALPTVDGWGRAFDFCTDSLKGSPATQYAIRSRGRDGNIDGSKGKKTYTMGETNKFDCDIIYSNGSFIVYPAGVQVK